MSILVQFKRLGLDIPKGSAISKQNGLDTEPCVYFIKGKVNFKVVCGAEGYKKTVSEDMNWIPNGGVKVGIKNHTPPLAHATLFTRSYRVFWSKTCIAFTYRGTDYLVIGSSRKKEDLAHFVRNATVWK